MIQLRHWLAASLLILPVTASAQTVEERFGEKETGAWKRFKPVQKIPETVTVLNAGEIDAESAWTLEDLESIAPNLIIDRVSGTPQGAAISIRGIGNSQIEKSFDPGVAIYVDGVYTGGKTNQMQVVFDFERIEVARGPQGTYQGKNSVGGAINITRKKPTGKFDAKVQISLSEYDHKAISGVVNFPTSSKNISGRLTINAAQAGGDYAENITTFEDENDFDYVSTRATFLWRPKDNVEVLYTYERENDDSDSMALLNVSTDDDLICNVSFEPSLCPHRELNLGPTIPQTGSVNRIATNFSNDMTMVGDYHTLRVDFDFKSLLPGQPLFRVTSITGVRKVEEEVNRDLDATHADFFSTIREQEYVQFSQEFNFLSEQFENYQYLLGFYYQKSTYDLIQQNLFILDQLAANNLIADSLPAGTIQYKTTRQRNRVLAVYGHLDYTFNEKWAFDVGARSSRERKTANHHPAGLKDGRNVNEGILLENSQDWNEFTARLGFRYKVDETAIVYGLYSRGFTSGGFSERAISVDSLLEYDPETVDNYELGIKTQWLKDKLRLNVTGFQMDYRDKQETFVVPVASGLLESITTNASKADISGVEVELIATPTERFWVRIAAGHLSDNYSRFLIPDLNDPGMVQDLSGISLTRVPEDSFSLSTGYSWNYGPGSVVLHATYRWHSDYDSNQVVPNTLVRIATIHNSGIWNASIRYDWKEWQFKLFSRNLKDQRHLQNAINISADYVASVDPATPNLPARLFTYSEYNQPRYTGFQITYTPVLH